MASLPSHRPLRALVLIALVGGLIVTSAAAHAHGVADRDEQFLIQNEGLAIGPYLYLGAKHMVTGYDHLAFLAGVIFFLYRIRDVAVYVTLFAVGHSITLLAGVLGGFHVNAHLIDAIIGLSVVYKGFENIGGFRAMGLEINNKVAVAVFGLFHGLGLATKLQDVAISDEGLIGNMLAFNLGVELGQFAALTVILLILNLWRASGRFERHAFVANVFLITVGLVLMGYQLTGFFLSS